MKILHSVHTLVPPPGTDGRGVGGVERLTPPTFDIQKNEKFEKQIVVSKFPSCKGYSCHGKCVCISHYTSLVMHYPQIHGYLCLYNIRQRVGRAQQSATPGDSPGTVQCLYMYTWCISWPECASLLHMQSHEWRLHLQIDLSFTFIPPNF